MILFGLVRPTLSLRGTPPNLSRWRLRRIAAGSIVAVRDYPYVVSLQDSGGHFCAGTMIAYNVVLTAAHCLDQRSDVTICYGTLDKNSKCQGTTHDIDEVVYHESYKKLFDEGGEYAVNDLALIRLKTPITTSRTVRTMGLFEQDEKINDMSNATIIGWGATRPPEEDDYQRGNIWDELKSIFKSYDMYHYFSKELRIATVQIISKHNCGVLHEEAVLKDQICTGSPHGSHCIGDSGGPLMIGGRQAGINSWGTNKCGVPGSLGISMSISHHRDWIDTKVNVLSAK
ncbi:hypothetical protein QAD02_004320 [Eretmocerus hayati]|uniref:Uncharacterized protein n=1 Tax=Eretmocerus hayati TaxID=131215 RepID=A0ACC2NP82_9HYME|nr:hypothetical protein QAD02_004320 [Eretmocerus hayati]